MRNMILMNLILWSCFSIQAQLHELKDVKYLIQEAVASLGAAQMKMKQLIADLEQLSVENKILKAELRRLANLSHWSGSRARFNALDDPPGTH